MPFHSNRSGKIPDEPEPLSRNQQPSTPHWLTVLNHEVIACTRCPRLVAYREEVAREKRRAYRDCEYWGKPVPGFGDPDARSRAYRDCEYWGKPVPGFGDPDARVLILGLAPGAHGS